MDEDIRGPAASHDHAWDRLILGLIDFISDADIFDEGEDRDDLHYEEMMRRDYCDNEMGIQ